MSDFTLKFDGWAPDLQNVAIEVDGSSGSVPAADCLNVYFQDAAFRCLPGPNPFAVTLGLQALNLLSGYDNIAANNYIYAGTKDGIQIFQSGAWSSVPIEPTVSVSVTGFALNFSTGGGSTIATVSLGGTKLQMKMGVIQTRGGFLLDSTLTAGQNGIGSQVGYGRGNFGALSPALTAAGVSVITIASYANGFGPGSILQLSGTFSQNYFTTLTCTTTGKTLQSNTASFNVQNANLPGALSTWIWSGASNSLGFAVGNSFRVRVIQ